MRPIHLVRMLPLCAVLLFAGCGGKTGRQSETGAVNAPVQQQTSKMIEPCELVTQEDATGILGEAVNPAEKREKQVVGMKLCMYKALKSDSMQFLQVSLTQDAFMPPGGSDAASIYRTLKDNFKGMRADIEGLGNEAFIASGGIYILADGYYIHIGAGNTDNTTVRDKLVEAGKTAVAKLKTLE